MRSFWGPIAVSAMNETAENASALLFARTLRAAFLGTKEDSTILIPSVGQTELYVTGALKLLETHGASVIAATEVVSLEMSGPRAVGVRLKSGKLLRAGSVISSVPHYAVNRLLKAPVRRTEPFRHFSSFSSVPIVSIHLWFGEDFMKTDYLGLIGRRVQWVFNRRRILKDRGGPPGYISAVISGAYEFVDRTKGELVELALEDLGSAFPESRALRVVRSVVIKEKRATFSPRNEVERLRPSAATPIGNFYLAGDWTNTGLPATIEGAVASGFRAAELIAGPLSGTAGGLSAV